MLAMQIAQFHEVWRLISIRGAPGGLYSLNLAEANYGQGVNGRDFQTGISISHSGRHASKPKPIDNNFRKKQFA